MSLHPYKSLPATSFWRASVAQIPPDIIDPVGAIKFKISTHDKVMTAGSCFAQHIAKHLKRTGFDYLVTEAANPILSDQYSDRFNYGAFTARYSNIYTTRQMLQLLLRAYGEYKPHEDQWLNQTGQYIDPFRPQIQPGGYYSIEEFQADREQHFAAVRKAIETLDIFVFTLGLTECWVSTRDGATFPMCPGTSGGEFDPKIHKFHNMTTLEILDDLECIRKFILEKNPKSKFIFTVSPVPLAATASMDHVLTATIHSKSVLRAAAGEFASRYGDVAYFPSYEIITGSFNRGAYFAGDLRSVTESGVSHVMSLFLKHYGGMSMDETAEIQTMRQAPRRPSTEDLVRVVCEEEALAQFEQASSMSN